MKRYFLVIIGLSIMCFQLTSCDKTEKPDDNVIVGGVYHDYTDLIINPCDVEVNIMDETFSFNKLEAIYSSRKTASNQNVLVIYLSDTINNKSINFQVFTPYMQPEDFFKKTSFNIDTVKIHWEGVVEDFFEANAIFKWDTVLFEELKFSGKASLDIPKEITGKINSNTYYPKQKIEFEF